jgi:hypothetical protein
MHVKLCKNNNSLLLLNIKYQRSDIIKNVSLKEALLGMKTLSKEEFVQRNIIFEVALHLRIFR